MDKVLSVCAPSSTSASARPAAALVGVVDTGIGNIQSVVNAFETIGASVHMIDRPAALEAVTHVVLPGVGAFAHGIGRLRERGFVPVLERVVLEQRKPFLGICLGMQLLATRSFEHGVHEGLGWIPGDVRRLTPSDSSLRVPHVGWNDVRVVTPCAFTRGLHTEPTCYFVHSYHLVPQRREDVLAVCDYGGEVVAAVARDNIIGVQFHPEKSLRDGLHLLSNFLALG